MPPCRFTSAEAAEWCILMASRERQRPEIHRRAIEALLEARPFAPFRIVVSDGTHHDIRHPNLVMLGLSCVIIGIPPGAGGHFVERTVNVSLFHVVRLEPLAAKGNGQAPGQSAAS
jgi:hypothetical protein